MKKARMLSMVLALLTMAGFVTSCGESAAGLEPTAGETAAAVTEDPTQESAAVTEDLALYADAVGEHDFEGRDFIFLLYDIGPGDNWSAGDVVVDELNGEIINDAVYNRNLELQSRFNINIGKESAEPALSLLTKSVSAGDDAYDAAFLGMRDAGSGAQKGYLQKFNDIGEIDLTKLYWDASCIRDLSIGGNVYFLTGDISSVDKKATWILMFNKDFVADYGLESPYSLVKAGGWTLEKFTGMSADVSADLDGDGEYTCADRYGLATTPDTVHGLFYSGGATWISKNSSDLPVFEPDVALISRIVEKTNAIMSDRQNTLLSASITKSPSGSVITDIRNCFTEGRAMFYGEVMFHVQNLRNMENDFGIIPMPKLTESQDGYVTYTNPAGPLLVVPVTVSDPVCTGAVLEAMASMSHDTLNTAYYDVALKSKYSRDDDSAEMLDLIFSNRIYDLTQIFGWGSICTSYQTLGYSGSNDIASLIASKQSAVEEEVEKFIDAFME